MFTDIRVLNGSSLRERDLLGITQTLHSVFGVPATIGPAELDLDGAYDASRRQSNSTALLSQILRNSDTATKRIAVVEVDLFIPVLTFVFGEAQVSDGGAVVSTHRLRQEFYGLAAHLELLRELVAGHVEHLGLLRCEGGLAVPVVVEDEFLEGCPHHFVLFNSLLGDPFAY